MKLPSISRRVSASATLLLLFSLPALAQGPQIFGGGSMVVSSAPNHVDPTMLDVTVSLPVNDASGLVVLLRGHEVIGSAPVLSSKASLTIKSVAQADDSLVAVYCGDSHYGPASTDTTIGTKALSANGSPAITVTTTPTPGHETEFATYVATLPVKDARGLFLFLLNNTLVASTPVREGAATEVRGIGSLKVVYTGDRQYSLASN